MKMLLRKNFYDTALHEVAIERSRFIDLTNKEELAYLLNLVEEAMKWNSDDGIRK